MVRTKFPDTYKEKPKKKGNKPGPKTTYREEIGEKAYMMALYGMTEQEMCGVLGVGENTWRKWKRDHTHLKENLDKGKLPADLKVCTALFKRAIGYEYRDLHWASKRKETYGANGQLLHTETKPVAIPYNKHMPPDMKAIQMWLSNRSKGRWTTMTHHKVEHSGEVFHRQQQVDLTDFSTEELKILKKYSVLQN